MALYRISSRSRLWRRLATTLRTGMIRGRRSGYAVRGARDAGGPTVVFRSATAYGPTVRIVTPWIAMPHTAAHRPLVTGPVAVQWVVTPPVVSRPGALQLQRRRLMAYRNAYRVR